MFWGILGCNYNKETRITITNLTNKEKNNVSGHLGLYNYNGEPLTISEQSWGILNCNYNEGH